MGQPEVDNTLEADSPPGVAYSLFRRGIERCVRDNINTWVFMNFTNLQLQQSSVARMISVHKSNIAKWLKDKDVPLDNVAPLSYAFVSSIPESERWERRNLDLKRYLPLPTELADRGYREVRDGLQDGGRGDGRFLEPEEFWWLFHLLADRKWVSAAAADLKTSRSTLYAQPNERENTRLYQIYSNKLKAIEWHLKCRAALDFTDVLKLFRPWLKPWLYGRGVGPDSPANSNTKQRPPSGDNYDWSRWK
jgi:hypothetical protein